MKTTKQKISPYAQYITFHLWKEDPYPRRIFTRSSLLVREVWLMF